jgi:hypothetical protein
MTLLSQIIVTSAADAGLQNRPPALGPRRALKHAFGNIATCSKKSRCIRRWAAT